MAVIWGGNMNRKYTLIFAVIIIVSLFFGCGETLSAPGDFSGSQSGGNGGGEAALEVPGSGGRTVGPWLDQSFNAGLGKPGMRIAHMSQSEINPADITIQSTLGIWEDGKFHIEGFGPGHNGGFQNAGFVETTLLYYDQPFEAEFKFSARVRLKRVGGVSTAKGIHFGAYINFNGGAFDTITDTSGTYPRFGAQQNSKGLGMFLRAESSPQYRLYYSDEFASTTAGNNPFGNAGEVLRDLNLGKEYIYEVSRVRINPALPYSVENAQYTYKLLDSKTGKPVFDSTSALVRMPDIPANRENLSLFLNSVSHPFGTTVKMHESLKDLVYVGILTSGSAAEISQIKIWDKGDAVWDYRADFIDTDGVIRARQLDTNGNPVVDEEGDFIIIASAANMPLFWTPETIPAYVPARRIWLRSSEINPARTPTNNSFNYTEAFYEEYFQNPGIFRIDLFPRVDPDFAESTIFYQLFPVGELPKAFADENGNPRIEGLGDKQEVDDFDTNLELYKRWRIRFEPGDLPSGTAVTANFLLVARDLTLDIPGGGIETPEYSLLQTLAEHYFSIALTKP